MGMFVYPSSMKRYGLMRKVRRGTVLHVESSSNPPETIFWASPLVQEAHIPFNRGISAWLTEQA